MIKMIHAVTGVEMWVDDARMEEYLARGHKLAPAPSGKPEKPPRKRNNNGVRNT